MANEMKAADLIGKVIIVGENIATITIKGVKDNGMLDGEFKRGDAEPMAMAVSMQNLDAQVEKGTWKIAGEAIESVSEPVPGVTIEEVEDIIPAKPVAKPEPTAEIKPIKPEAKPKSKAKSKAKSEKPSAPKAETKSEGKLTYSTYKSRKGKTCARISGFGDNDQAYVNAIDLHASASWETKKGKRTNYIVFGHRYVDAAKAVCESLNAGKSFEDCKAIVDGTRKPKANKGDAVVMDEKERETYELFKKFIAGDPEAMKLVDSLKAA